MVILFSKQLIQKKAHRNSLVLGAYSLVSKSLVFDYIKLVLHFKFIYLKRVSASENFKERKEPSVGGT